MMVWLGALALAMGTGGVAQAGTNSDGMPLNAPTATVEVQSEGGASAQATCYYPVASGGALVCFNPTGEHLYICDRAADGHHPVARYYRSDKSGLKTKHANVGNGKCLDWNLSIPESGWVDYRACNYEGSTALSCSSFSGRISAKG
ncbi:hypothetical protein OOZ19_05940 [Saccharopolyspora sp. NFXS83]|uniref:hypothetical protein n=1 Tax=Saccharopolyspora sp. NFXS83 TaxID=2993560 RepID=UPI00224A7947|nr:hypothetical protein [Saccharopolyspora sp. NFXS83]MCX2729772.1 hypothetical protein [Saccharopolyspora sp. NFXS83]